MNLETFVANGQGAQTAVNEIIDKLPAINPTPLLCRSAVRKFLLEEAGRIRAHKFTRVSDDTLLAINELVRRRCVTIVHQLPSKGKTI